ncbi:MAG: hypothetical protein JSV51_01590 [Candidatus Bathyarchaeota archaeon]|nr:MAG: hypothetical protein JSV51_01590 [Candidatus Bathyarchaeota archaeon]
MLPRTTEKSIPSQLYLSFNIENIDSLFPGFILGNFAVLHGSTAVLPLSMLLCIRAQLPSHLGGLESKVVFIDGGNTFRLYDISYTAQFLKLDPTEMLNRIFISRAFTAYQLTSIILDKLPDVIDGYDSKLVIVSDMAGLFLDEDVPEREARTIFNRLTSYLSRLAEESRIIIVATYFHHYKSRQDVFFEAVMCERADVVASVKPSKHCQQFVLEKHPFFRLGKATFHTENLALTRFMEV